MMMMTIYSILYIILKLKYTSKKVSQEKINLSVIMNINHKRQIKIKYESKLRNLLISLDSQKATHSNKQIPELETNVKYVKNLIGLS